MVQQEPIYIVSGLPRSGTSMMMHMLKAGGIPAMTDAVRGADADNPKGYFELECVKKLKEDAGWLGDAQGKAVKIISFLLADLPAGYRYKIVFMRRALDEILASQRQMLVRRGEDPDKVDDARMRQLYEKHLRQVRRLLRDRQDCDVLYLEHRAAIEAPQKIAAAVNAFLGGRLNAAAMAAAVDQRLHRQRSEGVG